MKNIRKTPSKGGWIRLAILLALFIALPLIFMYIDAQFLYSKYGLGVLYLFLPLTVLILSLIDGIRDGFGWWWIVAPALVFLPAVYIIYVNANVYIFILPYMAIGLIGNIIGALIHWLLQKRKQRKAETVA